MTRDLRFKGDEVFQVKPGSYLGRAFARYIRKDGTIHIRVLRARMNGDTLIRRSVISGALKTVRTEQAPKAVKPIEIEPPKTLQETPDCLEQEPVSAPELAKQPESERPRKPGRR